MFLKRQGLSLRAIASELNRSPSTLSRELQRRTVEGRPYDAEAAGLAARSARLLCQPRRKLVEGTDLHEVVVDMLRNKWSPQQISGTPSAVPVLAGLIVANKSRIWSASTCDRRKSKSGCCLGIGKAT